jgi:hypothetical protein
MRTRRRFSAEFKAKVALEAIKGQETVAEFLIAWKRSSHGPSLRLTTRRSSRAHHISSSPRQTPKDGQTALSRAECLASYASGDLRSLRFLITTATACSRAVGIFSSIPALGYYSLRCMANRSACVSTANCPRYIPNMQLVEPSVYAPRPGCDAPEPAWKGFKDFKDYVHPRQSTFKG